MSNVKDFLKRKDIVITPQRYLIEALGAMAQGLFASLLIGTIIKTLGQQTGLETLVDLGGYATAMSGPAMAVAIGWALHCPPLVLFSLVTVGYSSNALGGAGGPLAVLIIAIVAAELGKAVSKETRVDILVTPLVTIFAGVGLSMLIAAPIGAAASQVGTLIMWATEQAPFLMGILVSVIVGVALTLPISSAAICAALGLTGLAGGAAVAGCCAQMIGFAVMSYKENGVGGLISQGLGTSMLQMGNIVKNPRIWIAPTLASAITGPLATCVFHMEMNGAAVSSGMGTCGLVGQIGVYTGWVSDIAAGTSAIYGQADATAFGYAMGQVPQMPVDYTSSEAAVARLAQLPELIAHTVRAGGIVSSDSFCTEANVGPMRERFPDAIGADMETCAMAQVCWSSGVDWISLRAVSDLCGPTADQAFHMDGARAAAHSAQAVRAYLTLL